MKERYVWIGIAGLALPPLAYLLLRWVRHWALGIE